MRRSEKKAMPNSAGLECHSKKGIFCGHNEILKIAIHSQLMMQMKWMWDILIILYTRMGDLRKFW